MPNQPTISPQDAGPHQVGAEAADERVAEAIAGVSLAGISVETLEEARRLALAHGRFVVATHIENEIRRRLVSERVARRASDPVCLKWKAFEFVGQPLEASVLERDSKLIAACLPFCVLVDYYGILVAVSERFDDPVPPATFELWLAASEGLRETQFDVQRPPPIPELTVLAQQWRDLPPGSAEHGEIWEILVRRRGQIPDAGFRASVAAGLGFDAGDRLVVSIDKALQESATQSLAGGA